MKKLDWYIIRKFLVTFVFVLLIFAIIASVIDGSEKSSDFVKNKVPAVAILGYFKNFVPHIISLLYPLFIFIATIFFTSKLAYKSEIIAMLATGMSFNRFLRPYLIGAIIIGSVALAATHWIVPVANKGRLAFEERYVKEHVNTTDRNVHIQLSPELLMYLESYDRLTNAGYHFTAEKIKGTRLIEKTFADNVSYDSAKKTWLLRGVTIRTNDSLKERLETFPEITVTYPFTPRDLRSDEAVKEALTTPELTRYIERQKLHGNENLNFYYVEKHRRTATPAAGFILSIIGACIASRRIRGGSGLHLAIGIALCAIYMLCMQLTTTFATKAGFDPLLAVWIPNIIFGIGAFFVYRRQASGR